MAVKPGGDMAEMRNPLESLQLEGAEPSVHPMLARTPAYRVAHRRSLAEYTELKLPREFRALGSAFATDQGEPTAVCRAMQGMCLACCLIQAVGNPYSSAINANMLRPNALLFLAQSLQALGTTLFTFPLRDLGRALRPGGALTQLADAGQHRVRTKTHRSLGRWQKGLRVLASCGALFSAYVTTMFLGLGGFNNLIVIPLLFNLGIVLIVFVLSIWWPVKHTTNHHHTVIPSYACQCL